MSLPRYHYFGTEAFDAVKSGDTSVTTLKLYDGQVEDLEFMRGNCSIEALYVYNCKGLKSLDPIKDNTTITKLFLYGCSIESLEPLFNNTTIRTLDIRDNRHPIDISPLVNSAITKLRINRCGVVSIESLRYNVIVYDLNLHNNRITDISPLEGNCTITKLDLSENPIVDVAPIESMKRIEHLEAYECKIQNADPIFRNQTIEFADISNNHVASIESLRFNTTLDILYAVDNPIPEEHKLSVLLSNVYLTDGSFDYAGVQDGELVEHFRLNRRNLPYRLLTLKDLSYHHLRPSKLFHIITHSFEEP